MTDKYSFSGIVCFHRQGGKSPTILSQVQSSLEVSLSVLSLSACLFFCLQLFTTVSLCLIIFARGKNHRMHEKEKKICAWWRENITLSVYFHRCRQQMVGGDAIRHYTQLDSSNPALLPPADLTSHLATPTSSNEKSFTRMFNSIKSCSCSVKNAGTAKERAENTVTCCTFERSVCRILRVNEELKTGKGGE